MVWNMIPNLEVDGELIGQSNAIAHFLGKRFGKSPYLYLTIHAILLSILLTILQFNPQRFFWIKG